MGLRHVMVDIETFGTGRDAAIVSIGAVRFDPHQDKIDQGSAFYERVNLSISASPGTIDAATVEWWLQQSDEARKALVEGPRYTLSTALMHFQDWLRQTGDEIRLWSNGPTFDERILREAFERHGKDFPVSFRGSRCIRTLCALAGELGLDAGSRITERIRHDALDDAIHQARVVCAITQAMRRDIGSAEPGRRSREVAP